MNSLKFDTKKRKAKKRRRSKKRMKKKCNSTLLCNDVIAKIILYLPANEIIDLAENTNNSKHFQSIIKSYKLKRIAYKRIFDIQYPKITNALIYNNLPYDTWDHLYFLYKENREDFLRKMYIVMITYTLSLDFNPKTRKLPVIGLHNIIYELCNIKTKESYYLNICLDIYEQLMDKKTKEICEELKRKSKNESNSQLYYIEKQKYEYFACMKGMLRHFFNQLPLTDEMIDLKLEARWCKFYNEK